VSCAAAVQKVSRDDSLLSSYRSLSSILGPAIKMGVGYNSCSARKSEEAGTGARGQTGQGELWESD